MPRVVHFEVSADDPERAVGFYQGVFGWDLQRWGDQDYWLITTGKEAPGIDGGLMRRNPDMPSVVNTIDVPNLDDYIAKVTAAGGAVVAPKMAVAGVGYLAYCADTEGNVFGMMQADPSAA